MSTSEFIHLENAPVTEAAAKDLLDRGMYRLSSIRYSLLVDAEPADAHLRHLSNVSA